MRILIAGGGSGGHLYPGIAIARAVQKLRPDVKPFFVGAKRGIDPDVLPGTGFPYLLVDAHPLYRRDWWNNWRTISGLVASRSALKALFREEMPRVVIGTGGYAAVPALAFGYHRGVPIVEWTGDALPSLTARLFSRWCREIYLSFPESAQYLKVSSPSVLHDTGAPIQPPPSPLPDRNAALAAWTFPRDAKVVLVYGGSQGSEAINRATRDWIARGLPGNIAVIWSTGRKWFSQYSALESDRVRVREYLSPIADSYAATDIAIARSGTSTVAELTAWGIPAVLIPLPTAAADHQTLNAAALEKAGAAIHLPQRTLSAETLAAAVTGALADDRRLASLKSAALKRARPDAAANIAERIVAFL